MILTGDEINRRSLVQSAAASSYRAASYDLTIGTLVNPEGNLVDEYVIPAQGMVKVVSAERILMPTDLVGYVLVKTGLCNEGILALNIGVVDPGFEGPLSSALLNFGKINQRLRQGDVFGRLTIHQLSAQPQNVVPKIVTFEQAKRDAVSQVDKYLSATFLDIAKTADQAAKKAFGKYKTALFWGIPVIALLLAAFTLLLNFGNMWLVQGYFQPRDQVRAEQIRSELAANVARLSDQTRELADQLTRVQAKLETVMQTNSKTTKRP